MIVERTECAACKGTAFTSIARIDSREIVACQNCGFQFAKKFDTDTINKSYQNEYYPSPDAPRMDEWNLKNTEVWQSLCNDVTGAAPSVSSLLDIGAGTGGFLMEFQKKIPLAKLNAVESSSNAREFVSNKIPAVQFFTDLPSSEEFDVISLLQTMEHLEEPDLLCKKIFTALNTGGLFLLTVPNTAFLKHLWKKKENTLCYGNPTHLQFFGTRPLEKMLRDAGFKRITRIVKMEKGNAAFSRRFIQYLARFFGVSSELRYIAFKS
ncbi:MAG: hypothetical protein A2020_10400 [Lentisphaerae bacterium GWF2_45_14]|nr:MAG: hypothetical protein A2020_10400 [Lentisphaerae bacterium GWF2_45_14]